VKIVHEELLMSSGSFVQSGEWASMRSSQWQSNDGTLSQAQISMPQPILGYSINTAAEAAYIIQIQSHIDIALCLSAQSLGQASLSVYRIA
jgi:hypothetical protein